MKKRVIALMLGMCMVCSLSGCGGDKNESSQNTETENAKETAKAARTKAPKVSSVKMGVDPKEQVSKLCDYEGIEVTITGKYEVEEEDINAIILSDLNACGGDLVPVTNRDTVEKTDIVNIDYTGYMDGEAFDNGAATDTFVNVEGNKDQLYGSSYIEGFTDALVGAKVGDEVTSDVAFPEEYSNDPDKAGKDASFKMQVNGIYRQIEDLDEIKELAEDSESGINDRINEMYGSYSITTLQELIDYETQYVEYTLESNKYNDTVSAIKEYMIEHCEVTIPDDYLEARLTEYVISYENDNLDDTQSLEDYLQESYQVTKDEAMDTWKQYEEEQIKVEFIFSVIADKQGIKLDEDEFEEFITGILSSDTASSYGFEEEDDVYEYYGAGNVDNGKQYMQNLFCMNKAIDYVYENAKVNIEEPEETETTEGAE